MNLDQSLAKLDKYIEVIGAKLASEMEIVATEGTSLLTTRLQETGLDANGNRFKGYTPAYEQRKRGAIGGIQNEGARRKAARKVAQASQGKPIGRFQGFRDFTLTGEMIRRIGIIEQRVQGDRYVVRVGARDDHNREKMIGNDAVTPGWFTLAQKEQQQIAKDSGERMVAFTKQLLAA